MLVELQISNFAIIENQTISFANGLNVLSGETGAGKSIILQAMKLILGGRASSDFVRNGEDALEVSALFDLSSMRSGFSDDVPDMVKAGGEHLLLSRQVTSAGRSKVFVNGRLATVSLLTEISEMLISICSQNQSMKLNDPSYHRDLIDGYGGHEMLLQKYQEIFQEWNSLRQTLEDVEKKQQVGILRRAELEFLLEELCKLELVEGLRETLEDEIRLLSAGEQQIVVGQEIRGMMNAETGVFSSLLSLKYKLSEFSKMSSEGSKLQTFIDEAERSLDELDSLLSHVISNVHVDEKQLDDARERLSELARVERKYKTDSAGLIRLQVEAQKEFSLFEGAENVDVLKKELKKLEKKLTLAATQLHDARKKISTHLIKQVEGELAELNMKDTRLKVEFRESQFTHSGADDVEILISTNKGEPHKSIRQIASGGELSRIMLVLKKVLRDKSGVHVLVFDEVDTGVSGSVARAVGEKLRALAADSQVLCITHLPQVASMADHHLLVQKLVSDRTRVSISCLEENERVEEIARMLAGYEVTDSSRETARELLASNP